MLPPIIPLSVIPVTSQLDPVKPTPDIPPVVPLQPSASDNDVDLRQRNPEEEARLLREEQKRQQNKRRRSQEVPQMEDYLPVPGDELNADNTVPVAPLVDEQPRQGLWVDIQI